MSEQVERRPPQKKRATAEDKARAKRIERLAMRLWIAADQIGQVWRDAEWPSDIDQLRSMEHALMSLREEGLRNSV
jgi:hypothetical protein